MYIEKQSILKRCSNNTSVALREYCECINKSQAEVFIVMVQKAYCLFQILLEEGLLNKDISKRFFSSSVLEFDISEFENKKIAIVDDIIISGSAITDVANKLIKLAKVSDEKLEIIALARDIDYQTLLFTRLNDGKNMLRCVLDASDAECIEMSYEISHILAYRGRPYDADFPVYDKIEIDKKIYTSIMNFHDWDIFDITNDVQKDGNIQVFTFFPKKSIQKIMWKKLGFDISEFLHLKMRVYIQSYECDKVIMEIIPMALFYEISVKNIDAMIQSIFTTQMIKGYSYSAKLRVLQFYFAHLLKIVFVSKTDISECDLIYDNIKLIFGSQITDSIIQSMKQLEKQEKDDVRSMQRDNVVVRDLGYKKSFVCDTILENNDQGGYTINQALYQAIKYIYEKRELPARKKIKSPVKHFIRDYEIIVKELKRLQQGFSLKALEKIVEDASRFYKLEYMVSLFLDRGIDEGIVVPTIYYSKRRHYACRVYRHGEDLPFGDADRNRLLYFLQCFDDELKRKNGGREETFGAISFEKILVLFYQIGLKKEYHIFNRFLGFDNDPILQQRFSVHGIITAIRKENDILENHIYMEGSENYTYMVTRDFNDTPNKFITVSRVPGEPGYIINRDRIYEHLKRSKLNNMSENMKRSIKKIASVIAIWYWLDHNKSKSDFRDDITALTCCRDIYTYTSSVATSIHFFKLYWEGEAKGNLKAIRLGDYNKDFYSPNFDQVLPSGRDKYDWYVSKRAINVIKYVSKLLDDNGMENQSELWSEWWSDDLKNGARGDDLKQYRDLATQYMFFYSVCYEWLRKQWFLQENAKNSFFTQSEEAGKFFEKCKSISSIKDVINFFSLFDSVLEIENQQDRITKIIERMQEIIIGSEKIVSMIESEISEKSTTYSIIYTSVLIVDIESTDSDILNAFFRKVWESFIEEEEKTYVNIIVLGIVDEKYYRYGIFHEKDTEEAIEYLLRMYRNIHREACNCAYRTRAILIPMLTGDWIFKHNLKMNIPQYANDFMQKLSTLTDHILFTDHIHQLSFIKTWTTSPFIYEKVKIALSDYDELENSHALFIELLQANFECYRFVCGTPVDVRRKWEYSTVVIKVDDKIKGTGILFCYEENIYCVTCQHLLDKSESFSGITATMIYNQKAINLKPLNYRQETNRVSWDEILILKPEIIEIPELDRAYMFNRQDCMNFENELSESDTFYLYGFGLSDQSYGRVAKGLVPSGRVNNKFYQMDSNEQLGSGDSGAAIISRNTQKLFGIHAKSTGNVPCRSLAIQSKEILDVLKRVYRKE